MPDIVVSLVPDDCFANVSITFYNDRIMVTAYPGTQTACSNAYFSHFYTFDRWYFNIAVNALKDNTGFIFR